MSAKHLRAGLQSILSVQRFFGGHIETGLSKRVAQLAEALRRVRGAVRRELPPHGEH